jgi:F0F1-type ATP synthase assembly protein I
VRQLTIWQALAISSQFGVLLAVSVLIGFGLGWLVDRWLGVGPIAYFVGATLGMVSGVWSMVKLVRLVIRKP